jgi:hypothetical protein
MIDAPFAAKVLTVSDGVAAGTRDDRSGRALVERLSAAGYVVGEPTITPDGIEAVRDVITDLATGFAGPSSPPAAPASVPAISRPRAPARPSSATLPAWPKQSAP